MAKCERVQLVKIKNSFFFILIFNYITHRKRIGYSISSVWIINYLINSYIKIIHAMSRLQLYQDKKYWIVFHNQRCTLKSPIAICTLKSQILILILQIIWPKLL